MSQNEKVDIPYWAVMALVPLWTLLFVFGGVFGGMAIEQKIGPGAAFLFLPLWWGGMIGGTFYLFTKHLRIA